MFAARYQSDPREKRSLKIDFSSILWLSAYNSCDQYNRTFKFLDWVYFVCLNERYLLGLVVGGRE